MRFKVISILTSTVLGLLISGCSLAFSQDDSFMKQNPHPQSLSIEEKANHIVSQMSDSQKIGQLMMVGLQNTVIDEDANHMLANYPMGNVILFDRNMKEPEQLAKLNSDIKQTLTKKNGVMPLIAVDQEGGMVRRMTDYLPDMPSAEQIGQGNREQAELWAVKTGKALDSLGFNTNFAPVVDLDSSYHRSYGKKPEIVIPFAKAVIKGYDSVGLYTSLKHFPGIGKVKTDPHIDRDVVNITRENLDKEDGKPFKILISETDPNRTFIMVSNVTFPQLDKTNPACFSKEIITNILRQDYGFKGIILTDDMEMGAVSKHYAFKDMGVRAIKAGADIVLVCQNYQHEQEVFNGMLDAYRNGELDRNMIDEKVKHIVYIKLMHEIPHNK